MAIEQKWLAVPPRLFTADGSTLGIVTITDTAGFKVKQRVIISATGQPDLTAQCKRVISSTQLIVGPMPTQQGRQALSTRSDISAYTVGEGAYIYAEEQDKSKLTVEDIWSAVYEQEPTVAIRTLGVDQYGNPYTVSNPMPVVLESSISIAKVQVEGSDNSSLLNVNPDGSINVNIVETPVSGQVEKNFYNEVTSVASGVLTQIVSYTVPPTKNAILHRIEASGDNFARFDAYLNGVLFSTKRTWYGDFNINFEYITGTNAGFSISAGDVVAVKVLHSRPFLGTFEARIQLLETS